jgi:tetratricopeptide (TPR) repeat protein
MFVSRLPRYPRPSLLCCAGLILAWPASLAAQEKAATREQPYEPYKQVISTEQAIQALQQKLERNPKDAISLLLLGQTYVRRARETGDFSCYDRADVALRRALQLNPEDLAAQASLSQVLSANHKFQEGLNLALQVYAKHPKETELLMIVGDAYLELGRYDEAEKSYQELIRLSSLAHLKSRLARLAELRGDTARALHLMQEAAQEEGAAVLTREARAWYPMRLGEMCFNAGRLEEAASHYRAALKDHPKYTFALAGLGKVYAAQGKTDEALRLYQQAAALHPTLTMLAELGDLQAKNGKEFLARVCYQKLEKTGLNQDAYNREMALYYADHDVQLPKALELAKKDLTLRQDIYAWDTLAWTLYKNEQLAEAKRPVAAALRLGTKDATLLYHAGMIHFRLGEKGQAKDYLERALALNPHFSVLHAAEAQKTLATLLSKTPAP